MPYSDEELKEIAEYADFICPDEEKDDDDCPIELLDEE